MLEKYGIEIPPSIDAYLDSDASESPSPSHPVFAAAVSRMIATPQMSLAAAADIAASNSITPVILGDTIEGEAKDVAAVMAAIARQVKFHDQPAAKPCVLISGGETTVTVRSGGGETGRGGRNAEFLLALAVHLDGLADVYALACDTDGIDGTEDNAGAIITPDTLKRAAGAGLDAKGYLVRHDSYSLFDAIGDLIKTGPTRTNVNDFRAILIL